ncbi:MAG TPA: glycosyltransferase family 2 protein [Patescibacteria group bacterium]|nr:glycosyltransferase family 2 protein [Patescibacteria group bacterium]
MSIIILNYNTKKIALECVSSIEKNYPKEIAEGYMQIVLADNASTDGSLEAFKDYKKKTKTKLFTVVDCGGNIGFSTGNNKAIPFAKGKYILFLNPDTIVYPKTLTRMIEFMDSHPDAGASTCRVEIPNGQIDEASHRGFPTPWNAFTHFSKLEQVFPQSPFFSGYTRSWEDMTKVHQVPAIVGAFLFVRREAGEKIGWWDEDYFFYGEDLQFCYDLHKAGYAIYYVPDVKILHYGGVSSGIKKQSQDKTTASDETRKKVQGYRFDAMRIFYKKNYSHHHPFLTWIVMKGIDVLHKRNK